MDLRNLPESLSSHERCAIRRMNIQDTLDINLSLLGTEPNRIGQAEEKNCEQMFGSVPIPVGYAGPLKMIFSSQESAELHLPLATTEGALVASVNRGCKAASKGDGIRVTSIHHGITRSIALKSHNSSLKSYITEHEQKWQSVGHSTSSHLKILSYDVHELDDYVFLTINADTDEAMGMNMVTIAAQEIGNFLEQQTGAKLVTVAGNVDSDKKPSRRTKDKGRGYEVIAEAILKPEVIKTVLHTEPEKLLEVYEAKLKRGSELAGALGANLHTANIVAALYLALGQDIAHTVEGSLADTTVSSEAHGISIRTRLPAVLVGVRGGGTNLPAQKQCLDMLMKPRTNLRPTQQLAESIAAAVLAGEISLLAAQASQKLASSHKKLAR